MRTRSMLTLAALAALALVPSSALAQARSFVVRNDGGSRAQFVSDAPLETITGVTSAVTGALQIDPANLSTARGRIAVTIGTIRTGVDLRDEHLRGPSWLDAARFGEATFELTRVEGASALAANQRATLRLTGRFSLHGVTREVVATATVRLVPLTPELAQTPGVDGDVLRAQATFSVRLTDYAVSVPALVRLKVSNEIQVSVDLRAIAARPPAR